MTLLDRARSIVTVQALEWQTIAMEATPVGALLSRYVVPLALIPPVCSFLSSVVFLHRPPLFAAVFALVSRP